jgi:hypothetical protein
MEPVNRYDLSKFEQHVNLFNMRLAALIYPETGADLLTEEEKIAAMRQQIQDYERDIAELSNMFNKPI